MDAQTTEQLDAAAYRDALLKVLQGHSAERLEQLAERAILALDVITTEFARRYPVEFEAWNEFGAEDVRATARTDSDPWCPGG